MAAAGSDAAAAERDWQRRRLPRALRSAVLPKNFAEYIAGYPEHIQAILKQIRLTIKKAVPDAEETMRYHMPTLTWRGKYLIHFAAYAKHIGLYPVPRE